MIKTYLYGFVSYMASSLHIHFRKKMLLCTIDNMLLYKTVQGQCVTARSALFFWYHNIIQLSLSVSIAQSSITHIPVEIWRSFHLKYTHPYFQNQIIETGAKNINKSRTTYLSYYFRVNIKIRALYEIWIQYLIYQNNHKWLTIL